MLDHKDFCLWLSGVLEMHKELSESQLQVVREKLARIELNKEKPQTNMRC